MKKLLLATILAITLVGCGTTPQAKVTQAQQVVVTSVDASMNAWADYVKNNSFLVPQDQRDAVHKAYNTYYNAQIMAKAAIERWVASKSAADEQAWATANKALNDAQAALVNLIHIYTTH